VIFVNGMIIGIQKRRIEKYKTIARKLLNKQELNEEEKEFLAKENVLEE